MAAVCSSISLFMLALMTLAGAFEQNINLRTGYN